MAKPTVINHDNINLEHALNNHFKVDADVNLYLQEVIDLTNKKEFSTIYLEGSYDDMKDKDNKLRQLIVRRINILKTNTNLSYNCLKNYAYAMHDIKSSIPHLPVDSKKVFKLDHPKDWPADLYYKYMYKNVNIFSFIPLHANSHIDGTLKSVLNLVPGLQQAGLGKSCPSTKPHRCSSNGSCCQNKDACVPQPKVGAPCCGDIKSDEGPYYCNSNLTCCPSADQCYQDPGGYGCRAACVAPKVRCKNGACCGGNEECSPDMTKNCRPKCGTGKKRCWDGKCRKKCI